MPSLRCKILFWTFRSRQRLHALFQRGRPDWSQWETISRFREQCERGARRFGRLPEGISVQNAGIGTIHGEWIVHRDSPSRQVLFFVHGGGYVSGSCADHRIHASKFVSQTGVRALLYDYRLAPEHPFPAALEDSICAYTWLLSQNIPSENIVFVGDSAGGGLVLALLLALRDQNISLPAAAVCISPWTDLSCQGNSYRLNASKCLSPAGTWQAFSQHYLQGQNPKNPYISPLYGDPRNLPPLFISAGSNEILRDDARDFALKASAAKTEVILRIEEGMFHCFPVCAPLFPEASQAMNEICTFIKSRLPG